MRKIIRFLAIILILTIGAAGLVGIIYRRMKPQYDTETAFSTDYSVSVDATALFLRDETEITSEIGGAYYYQIPEGAKVAKSNLIAQIYQTDEEIAARAEWEEKTEELARLKRLEEFSRQNGEGETALSRRIADGLTEWMRAVRTGDPEKQNDYRAELLESISRRQLLLGESLTLTDKIEALQARCDALAEKSVEPIAQVRASRAGYFSAVSDGYESLLNTDMAENFTVQMLEELPSAEKSGQAVGKIVKNHVWYAVCRVTGEQARRLTKGTTVSLRVNSIGMNFSVTVAKINKNGVNGDATVILRGERSIADVIALRRENVQIEIERYSGLKINRDAVHFREVSVRLRDAEGNYQKDAEGNILTEQQEVPGVYIIYGEQIKFREIAPVYWGENFVICALSATPTGTTPMLKRYDRVVVGGKDIYDGKYVG